MELVFHSCPVEILPDTACQTDSIWYPQSEACLTVNVIRSSSVTDNSKLPVAVWIHGGGFFEGSGSDQRYNMSRMIENSYNIGKFLQAIF